MGSDLLGLEPEEADTTSIQGLTDLLGSDVDLLGSTTDSQEGASGMLESTSALPDLIGPIKSIERSKESKNTQGFMNLEEMRLSQASNQGMFSLNQPYSGIPTQNTTQYSSPQIKSEQPRYGTQSGQSSLSYSGFTIQGGKIPRIPCETGNTHSISSPIEPPHSGCSDPLSPTLIGSQPALPPPLIPSIPGERQEASGSGQKCSEKKGDALDKVCDVLGDIVDTFDSLL